MQWGYIKFDNDQFDKIKENYISRITVKDIRENTSVIGRPYKRILSEQSNCNAEEVCY